MTAPRMYGDSQVMPGAGTMHTSLCAGRIGGRAPAHADRRNGGAGRNNFHSSRSAHSLDPVEQVSRDPVDARELSEQSVIIASPAT